ncbi:MAG: DUF368 domain-containing protein [Bacteroidota bacterium]
MPPFLLYALKGIAMGAANVIPGVSGGTIAFITNIYERLINALKAFDIEALKMLFRGEFKAVAEKVDLSFLVAIFSGIFISILTLANVLEWLFVNHEILTLAFFFGLIVASLFAVGQQVGQWSLPVYGALIIGALIAILIAFLPPATANDGFFYVFLCGVVAICSMILPGLSGAYILLLMGNYILVLGAIRTVDLGVLVPLGLGCIVGLIVFSRLLSYLFAHYKDQTVGLMMGFVAGSLLIIWPWKTTEFVEVGEGKEKAMGYTWNIPDASSELLFAVLLSILGFLIVFGIEKAASRKRD